MQWIDNCCPSCLSNCIRICCVYLSKKFRQKKKSYEGLNELQEEEFRFKQKAEKKIFTEKINNKEPVQISLNEQIKPQKDIEMEVKLLLNESPHNQLTSLKPQQEQKTNNLEERQAGDNYQNFKINIDPFSPYYAMVQQRVQNAKNIKSLLQKKGQQIQLGQGPSNLKIYQTETAISLQYLMTYNLPCSYSFYSNLMSSSSVKEFNPLIEDCLLLETVQPNLRIHYLSFAKFMMLQSRQFTYLKYIYGSDNQNWQVCISIAQKQGSQPQIKGKQKIIGQIFSITHLKQINDAKGVNLAIRTYLLVDLKSSIKNPKVISRGLVEIKNYVDNLYQYSKNRFQQQLA